MTMIGNFLRKVFHVRSIPEFARALDVDQPGWEDSVFIPALDLDSADNCLLAQVYKNQGGWWVGAEALRVNLLEGMFCFTECGPLARDHWIDEIIARQRTKILRRATDDMHRAARRQWERTHAEQLIA